MIEKKTMCPWTAITMQDIAVITRRPQDELCEDMAWFALRTRLEEFEKGWDALKKNVDDLVPWKADGFNVRRMLNVDCNTPAAAPKVKELIDALAEIVEMVDDVAQRGHALNDMAFIRAVAKKVLPPPYESVHP